MSQQLAPAKLIRIRLNGLQPLQIWGQEPFPLQPWRFTGNIEIDTTVHSDMRTARPGMYTGLDVVVGDYIATQSSKTLKITAIISQTDNQVNCELEDVFRLNSSNDESQNGESAIQTGPGLLFTVLNNRPILHPLPLDLGLISAQDLVDIYGRFLYMYPDSGGGTGADGKSAYEIAVENGFVGSEAEWLASLVGPAGKSAYEIAVENGFVGSEAEWLDSFNNQPQVLNSSIPTPTTLGGIPAGTTFDNMPVETVLYNLLYPYQTPSFTNFAISGQSTTIEVGETVPGANRTFTWTTSNSANVTTNSVSIQNITGSLITLVSGSANDGSEIISFSNVTKTSASTHTWKINATNTQATTFSRDFSVSWQWRRYFGETSNTNLNEAGVKSLRVSALSAGFSGTYSFFAGGYKWIAYPTVFGTATTFKDSLTNLDVPFEPPYTIILTNASGIAQDYRVHRTTNILGAAITIAVS